MCVCVVRATSGGIDESREFGLPVRIADQATMPGRMPENRGSGMTTDRQFREIISRCVSTMVFYHDSVRSCEVVRWVLQEVRDIAVEVADLGLEGEEAYQLILRPVEDDLIRRYGHEVGPRISGRFIDEFEGEFSAKEPAVGV